MKTYNDLITFVKQNNISENSQILVAFRETALSDIEYLKLIIEGNVLRCTDDYDISFGVQKEINTIKDIIDCINTAKNNEKNKIHSPIDNNFENEIFMGLIKNKTHYFSTSGYKVRNFIYTDDKLILDIEFDNFNKDKTINTTNKTMNKTELKGMNTRMYEIWSEGYRATGELGLATYHDCVEANTFQEACDKLAEEDSEFKRCYDRERMTYWGCQLFDNELDARRNFG